VNKIPVKPTEKILGFEEQVAKSLDSISPKDIKEKSDLSDDLEIYALSVVYTWAEEINCKLLKIWADNFLKLRNSKFRLGRREIVAIASYSAEPERRKLRSLRDLFAGLGR
jgi:hypothetical protein